MKYVLNETNCIKGTRGLQHVLDMLHFFGDPSCTELANRIDTDYSNRMEMIRRQYPHELQPVNVDRFKRQKRIQSTQTVTTAQQEEVAIQYYS